MTATAACSRWNDCRGLSRAAAGAAAPHRAFALWFTLVVLASGFGLLDPVKGFGVPALGFAIVVPIVVMAFVATSSGERLQRVLAIPMPALILTHVLRILAVQFLLLWSAGRLTAPFAPLRRLGRHHHRRYGGAGRLGGLAQGRRLASARRDLEPVWRRRSD